MTPPGRLTQTPQQSGFVEALRSIYQPQSSPSFRQPANSSVPENSHLDDPHHSHHSEHPEPLPRIATSQPDLSLAESLELLAIAISNVSGPPKSSSNIKPRIPDIFDGSDPSQVDTFVFQCAMYFSACSKDFPDGESQVMFALSYLMDEPLDWFQLELSDSLATSINFPPWFTSFSIFVSELRRHFGPRDPVSDAISFLEALQYDDSTQATRYNIDFNRHSHRTGWNEQALSHQYYVGLPDRLKDELARIGKPTGLKPLQDLVAMLDQRYWERQSEISRQESPTPSPTSDVMPPPSPPLPASAEILAENSAENPKNIPGDPPHTLAEPATTTVLPASTSAYPDSLFSTPASDSDPSDSDYVPSSDSSSSSDSASEYETASDLEDL